MGRIGHYSCVSNHLLAYHAHNSQKVMQQKQMNLLHQFVLFVSIVSLSFQLYLPIGILQEICIDTCLRK